MTSSGPASIRALQEEDIGEVARLWDRVFRSSSLPTMTDPRGFLRHTLLSNPWMDSELPSLVYVEDDGKIVGFIGSSVRRMVFDGQPIRAVCSAHFVTDPATRARGAGALLFARLIRGPQELTMTDTATAVGRAMWEALDGDTVHLGSVSWIRILRPSRVARSVLARRFGSERWFLRAPAPPVWLLVDVALRRAISVLSGPASSAPAASILAEPLTAAVAVEHLPTVAASFRLRPDYDESYLETLFRDLDRFGEGVPVRRLVRSGGQVLGSYVYLLQRGSICRVLQVAARERDAEAVLRDLFEHARAHEAAALIGRVEPHLQEPLHRSGVLLFPAGTRALIHSRNPELLHAIHSGNALITRLDGEWW